MLYISFIQGCLTRNEKFMLHESKRIGCISSTTFTILRKEQQIPEKNEN